MEKNIKEVFSDYNSNSFELNEARIKNVNIYKKTNTLELELISSKVIDIEVISKFEKYLKERFKIKEIKIVIEFEKEVDLDGNILNFWKNITSYIKNKHPLCSAMLKNSTLSIENEVLNVNLALTGKEILEAKKFDLELQNIYKNLLGVNLKVVFSENISKDELKAIKESFKRLEEEEMKETLKNTVIKTEDEENIEVPKEEIKEKNIDIEEEEEPKKKAKKEKPKDESLIYGRSSYIRSALEKIETLDVNSGRVCVEGEVLKFESKELRNGKFLLMFDVYDGSSTMTCKSFVEADDIKEMEGRLKKTKAVKLEGNVQYDPYAKETGIIANTIVEGTPMKKEKRMDNSREKRVELHMHTKMSQMDAVSSAHDLLQRADEWGMKAIAITDHGVVQSFPEANHFIHDNKTDLKVIYGVEAYLAPDKVASVSFSKGQSIDTVYCVLDIETTGFSFRTEKITEIGIMKIQNGEVIDTYSTFVNPQKPIPQKVVEITNITDDMVKNERTIDEVFPEFMEFISDSVLVAHNADFDIGFLKHNAKELGYTIENTYIDTLSLAKDIFTDLKNYKLGTIAESLDIKVLVAHRALDDVDTTVKVFNIMIEKLKEFGVSNLDEIEAKISGKSDFRKLNMYHTIILAKNYTGLKNLYKLVSYSHVDYFFKKPRILKSMLKEHSEGLIIGSACERGEIYRAIMVGKTDEELEKLAGDYDYLEIQPTGNNMFMVKNGDIESREVLEDINRKIVKLGEKTGKPVVATCDVHFLDPADEIYRRILMASQGYSDADEQAPLYFRTTEEMLEEFSYLGSEKAHEVVITNTNLIADMCEKIEPISKEKCPPHIEGCEQDIRDISYEKAYELYGNPLPKLVEDRLEKELNSIIDNGFSVMYIIAQKLVWKSNEDGYIVGSRGSVGSSFAAFTTGITEVNSLPPHYRCPKCKYSDFEDYGYQCGYDLPQKACPNCGTDMEKDGLDIPFETFLGFNGDKEPDIDLNFSGEYQAKAHRYTEEIFGKGTTFKAGTVGTVADKTAFAYVYKYYEERERQVPRAEMERVSTGCTGVKKTSGQHPGGIIVVPKGREIYEFCPVQRPADDPTSDITTTHFDYHSIDQNLLKLDILGHDDPTMIRMLHDLTGIDPTKIPLDDEKTMSIFSSTDALGVTPEQIKSKVGSYGIPEFGTKFVRGMLVDTKPSTFDELIRISGLSHGTDVWLNNAQTLIQDNVTTLNEAICCRDDIMIYLIKKGVPPDLSFKIMEVVRKGKALKDPDTWAKNSQIMRDNNVPDWYIKSCETIKYMFPKAHAAAYVTNAFRIAYFKVHHPQSYYASFFTIRADEFDGDMMCYGKQNVIKAMEEIDKLGFKASNKEQKMYPILELVLEMYERNIEFLPVDLYKSHATNFLIEDEKIRPPLNCIPGIGTVAALGIQEARKSGEEFISIEDLQMRASIGKSVTEILQKLGCLNGMSKSSQMSFFT